MWGRIEGRRGSGRVKTPTPGRVIGQSDLRRPPRVSVSAFGLWRGVVAREVRDGLEWKDLGRRRWCRGPGVENSTGRGKEDLGRGM